MTLLEFLDQKAGSPPRTLTFPPRELRTMVGAIGDWIEQSFDTAEQHTLALVNEWMNYHDKRISNCVEGISEHSDQIRELKKELEAVKAELTIVSKWRLRNRK